MQNQFAKILLIVIIAGLAILGYRMTKHTPQVTSPVTTTIDPKVSAPESQSKEEIQVIIKEFILNNPEVIIESIEQMQKKKMKEMEEQSQSYLNNNKSEIENSANLPFIGRDQATSVIVFFYDYNCSYCKKADLILQELIKSGTDVKVVYRPFPILGEPSLYAAKVILAINKIAPDKTKAIHEDLMKMQRVTKEAVESLAISKGLKYNEIEEAMKNPSIQDTLNKSFEVAARLRINGAPVFIINGSLTPGLLSIEQIKQSLASSKSDVQTTSNQPAENNADIPPTSQPN